MTEQTGTLRRAWAGEYIGPGVPKLRHTDVRSFSASFKTLSTPCWGFLLPELEVATLHLALIEVY